MTEQERLHNEPAEFRGGAPRHRLFATFEDPSSAEEALEALRFEGYGEDKVVWVFAGDEGAERVGTMARAQGLWGRGRRVLQRAMSSDFTYLRTLDVALRDGQVVVAVWVRNERAADEVGRLLRLHDGRSLAYFTHWDFVPVAA